MLAVGGDEHLVADGNLPRQGGGEREGMRAARRYVDGHHADGPLQPVEALALQPDSGLPRLVGVVVEDEGEAVVAGLDRHQPVGVGVPHRVPDRFADPGAVDHRPGRDRPAVVELPDDHPLVSGVPRAQVLDAEPDRAGLLHGHRPVPVVHGGRFLEVGRETPAQLEVAVLGLLVAPHPRRRRVSGSSWIAAVSVDQAGGPWYPNSATNRGDESGRPCSRRGSRRPRGGWCRGPGRSGAAARRTTRGSPASTAASGPAAPSARGTPRGSSRGPR